MKISLYKGIWIALLSVCYLPVFAQTPTSITLSTDSLSAGLITLVQEDVVFHPNLGVGLADTKKEVVSTLQLDKNKSKKADLSLSAPTIFKLQIAGQGYSKTWILFVQPGDQLKVLFDKGQNPQFSGTNAGYQEFLKTYFLENQYQYLPVFGYNPSQIDNQIVLAQSDSLQKLRKNAWNEFKASEHPAPAFEAYVKAVTMAEPILLYRLIQERLMRRNRVKVLDPEQRKELENYTLEKFEIQSDDALLSEAYRDELRKWVLIPTLRKYPVESSSRYELSPEALRQVYQFSKAKFAPYPKQQAYLLTYWLNYANTAIPDLEPGKSLLQDYQATLPQSPYLPYLTQQVTVREKLTPGASLPAVTLSKLNGESFSLDKWKGKPLVLVFAYSIGQHEPGLSKMETLYQDKVQFAYVSVIQGVGIDILNKHLKDRDNAMHLSASSEAIRKLEKELAIDIRYPFLVADAAGSIVNRWIPQEFPDNAALKATIQKALAP
ncbi:TlpA family protein disulfide reductase [Dyadobacter tibetensis]|uniref:TlpA family protein disulfide reductase n=1 Tax=Dyadobacter tibetensis TaxID=1211851 RepID=UPI00046F0A9A|nr:hypothetical protein [Dyadobacter tibetensis]